MILSLDFEGWDNKHLQSFGHCLNKKFLVLECYKHR